MLTRPEKGPPEQVLSQVRQRLQAIADPDQRRRTTSGCQLLAGLTFSQDVIQRLLAMSILEDSGDALLDFQGPADLKRRLRRIETV